MKILINAHFPPGLKPRQIISHCPLFQFIFGLVICRCKIPNSDLHTFLVSVVFFIGAEMASSLAVTHNDIFSVQILMDTQN